MKFSDAMNRIGGKSNSGEGGEDPIRYKVLEDVDEWAIPSCYRT